MASELPGALLSALAQRLGPRGLVTDATALAPHLTEWRGLYHGRAAALLAPASTAEAAAAISLCAEAGIAMVPQGGNTGLVGGAIPRSRPQRPQVILSAARLNRIRELDSVNDTITAEAGCVLATVQAAAADAGRLFPLSLAAEGSCQLGGNIATNAGGINVLRYGSMREQVLGLEVVLPDGQVFNGLRALRKDNTGYDLKQLFIGSEGTLGFITAAVCRLYPRPASTATAFVALGDPATAVALYGRAREALGDQLQACELIGRPALELVLAQIAGSRDPFDEVHPWYLLLELGSVDQDAALRLEHFLATALESAALRDAVLAHNEAQRDALWRLRHSISEAQKLAGAGIKHDVSVPVSRVPELIERGSALARQRISGVRVVAFGHLGDGNIHFNLNQPPGSEREAFLARWPEIASAVHELVAELGGSFSAEHGIGQLKTAELARYRGGVELALMRRLKACLDPQQLMNPGKLLPPGE